MRSSAANEVERGLEEESRTGHEMDRTSVDTLLVSLDQPPLVLDSFVLFSGGAEGVDTLFDDLMAEFAPRSRCIHWSFRDHHHFSARSAGRVNLPEDLAARFCDPFLRRAAQRLHQSMPRKAMVRALLQRNMCQVLWADAVYAITWEDPKANYPHCVGGGTKWAVQAYIDRFEPLGPEPAGYCKLFFYEVNSGTWRLWSPRAQRWHPLASAPGIHRSWRFAGIGTREPPSDAKHEARRVFQNRPFGADALFDFVVSVLKGDIVLDSEAEHVNARAELQVWSRDAFSFGSACDALADAIGTEVLPVPKRRELEAHAHRFAEHGVGPDARLPQALLCRFATCPSSKHVTSSGNDVEMTAGECKVEVAIDQCGMDPQSCREAIADPDGKPRRLGTTRWRRH